MKLDINPKHPVCVTNNIKSSSPRPETAAAERANLGLVIFSESFRITEPMPPATPGRANNAIHIKANSVKISAYAFSLTSRHTDFLILKRSLDSARSTADSNQITHPQADRDEKSLFEPKEPIKQRDQGNPHCGDSRRFLITHEIQIRIYKAHRRHHYDQTGHNRE
tara:strand:+ start:13146 stop:13643 length:498 start_codon:yes stop_codon:yes gene_type:complete